jgi:hypothetical protein
MFDFSSVLKMFSPLRHRDPKVHKALLCAASRLSGFVAKQLVHSSTIPQLPRWGYLGRALGVAM